MNAADVDRRDLLGMSLWGAAGLSAATAPAAAKHVAPNLNSPQSWGMMFDLTVRTSPGVERQWDQFWGDRNIPLLEQNGQWLWAAWRPLTGQLDTVTHQWAYRNLEHFQAMAQMRATNSEVHALASEAVPIYETLAACMMIPLPYHPGLELEHSSTAGVVVTRRIVEENGVNAAAYNDLMAEYLPKASVYGGRLSGAFRSVFGWTPASRMHIWRYASFEQFGQAERSIAADAHCQRLEAEMRRLFPREVVAINIPLRYSRLQ